MTSNNNVAAKTESDIPRDDDEGFLLKEEDDETSDDDDCSRCLCDKSSRDIIESPIVFFTNLLKDHDDSHTEADELEFDSNETGEVVDQVDGDSLAHSPASDSQLRHRLLPLPDVSRALTGYSEEIDKILAVPRKAAEEAEEIVRRVVLAGWNVVHLNSLPGWLRDNDHLHFGHRPQLPSVRACFKSIFRIHTETGNIWTHLLGFIVFMGIAAFVLFKPSEQLAWQDKVIFSAFFFGATVCLGFSWVFHTVCCYSPKVNQLFNKLDYCGISAMIIGSFIPFLYYGYYCHQYLFIVYLSLILTLGFSSIFVCCWEQFRTPEYRPLRASLFIGMGLSGVIPALHFSFLEGLDVALEKASLLHLIVMAALYISGAVIYAMRFPERYFPGYFDIWGQSHTIFHICVIVAAFVHYEGINKISAYRLDPSHNCDL